MASIDHVGSSRDSGMTRRERLAPNAVFGMGLFVFTEVMLFAAFISSYTIARSSAIAGLWPPPNQPRLPLATTAFNTAALLASGVLLYLAHRAYQRRGPQAAVRPMGAAILLGGFFVVFQGTEWVALIRQGLTLTSSQLGSFFYVIVGAHALHAVAALIALVVVWVAMRARRASASVFGAVQLFWYFVVLIWPVIFLRVYP